MKVEFSNLLILLPIDHIRNGREREKAQMEMGTAWSQHLCRGTKCGKKQVNGECVGNQEFSLKHVNF